MAQAKIDENNVPTMMGVLNTDGVTPTLIQIDPSTHFLAVDDGATGSDLGNDIAYRDQNGRTTMVATDANGNIINLYVNSSGQLLIDST